MSDKNEDGGLEFFRVLLKDIRELEIDLGMKKGKPFLYRLQSGKDDDWTVIVKLSAYFETTLSHLLAERLSEALTDVISHMPMADKKAGKITMAYKLGFFPLVDFGRLFLFALAEVRNLYAHRIDNIDLSLLELKAKYPKRINMAHLLGPEDAKETKPVLVRTLLFACAAHTQLQLLTARIETKKLKAEQVHGKDAREAIRGLVAPKPNPWKVE